MQTAQLLSQQFQVYFSCRSGSYIEAQKTNLTQQNIPVTPIPFKGNLSLTCIVQLRQLLRSESIHNILFYGASELKSIVLACRGLNINIVNFHGTTKNISKKNIFHNWIYRNVDKHIAVSEHIKKNVLSIIPYSTETNVEVIGLPYTQDICSERPINKPRKLIHVGRIAHGKGHMECLMVLQKLLAEGLETSIDFIGPIENQNLYQDLLNFIKANPRLTSKVHFKGFSKNVSLDLRQSDILLFPSHGEGLPNAVIEAFFNLVIPVSFNNTVFPEFIDKGFYFPQAQNGDTEDLYQKTKSVLLMSDENLKACGTQNQTMAKNLYSADSIVAQYSGLFRH